MKKNVIPENVIPDDIKYTTIMMFFQSNFYLTLVAVLFLIKSSYGHERNIEKMVNVVGTIGFLFYLGSIIVTFYG